MHKKKRNGYLALDKRRCKGELDSKENVHRGRVAHGDMDGLPNYVKGQGANGCKQIIGKDKVKELDKQCSGLKRWKGNL